MNYAIPHSHRGLGLRFATLCVAAAVSLSVPAKEPTFEQIFSAKGEPAALHYRAVFISKGAEHRLEVWRDGDRRLKRRTDDAIEIYVLREPGDAEFRMSILDMEKRIHTRIDRTNLYRIGNFTDWFDLAHGLRHPMGEYRVAKARAPDAAPKPIAACQWYDLTQDQRTTHICWSAQSRIPLAIQAQEGEVVWRVTALDQKPIPVKTFDIHDAGFVRNDANQDIERD
ncbi:MAG: hypothetical protein WCV99_23470 [Sterolibacterium sp.]